MPSSRHCAAKARLRKAEPLSVSKLLDGHAQALGKINGRLHMVVFTVRGESLRIISLRKANAREVARYEKA